MGRAMKIYDISQEVLSSKVYPGDPSPEVTDLLRISRGDVCNLSSFSMCAHNGTHVDAPLHFIEGGAAIDELPLDSTVGYTYVAEHYGVLSAVDADLIIRKAKASAHPESASRILIKGEATVSAGAAKTFAENGVLLVGNESQTVGPEDAPAEVHNILLGKGIVLLEGIRLSEVSEGAYFLFAAPLSFKGFDGSPCRAVLIGK